MSVFRHTSFENLYQNLKVGLCSSFYLCTPTFTILFLNTKGWRKSHQDDDSGLGLMGSDGLKAIISVTSKVMRQAFRDEGKLPALKIKSIG